MFFNFLMQKRYDDAIIYAGDKAYAKNDFTFQILMIKCGYLAKSARLLIRGTKHLDAICKRFPRIAKRYYEFLTYGYYRVAEIIAMDSKKKDARNSSDICR